MITELKWDSAFFRKKIGRLTGVLSDKKLKKHIRQARKNGYAYLSCRLIVKRLSEIQTLGNAGFYLTDVGVLWEKEISVKSSEFKTQTSKFSVREAAVEDAQKLKQMVKGLFRDSRFYNDPFFTKGEAEKFYRTWIENLVWDKKVKTFLVEGGGFVTCKKVSGNKGNIPLVGVIPRRHGKGIGQSLMYEALKWFKKAGVKAVNVRTQANNISAMNFYTGLGFRIKHVDVTMGMIIRK